MGERAREYIYIYIKTRDRKFNHLMLGCKESRGGPCALQQRRKLRQSFQDDGFYRNSPIESHACKREPVLSIVFIAAGILAFAAHSIDLESWKSKFQNRWLTLPTACISIKGSWQFDQPDSTSTFASYPWEGTKWFACTW